MSGETPFLLKKDLHTTENCLRVNEYTKASQKTNKSGNVRHFNNAHINKMLIKVEEDGNPQMFRNRLYGDIQARFHCKKKHCDNIEDI